METPIELALIGTSIHYDCAAVERNFKSFGRFLFKKNLSGFRVSFAESKSPPHIFPFPQRVVISRVLIVVW
jgi:hypothetical protein